MLCYFVHTPFVIDESCKKMHMTCLTHSPPTTAWTASYLCVLLQVIFSKRFCDDRAKTCKVMLDGINFQIQEPTPFSKHWYSHKFKGPGLRYKVTVSIQSSDIVWTNGPFACGLFPDISIFSLGLKDKLKQGEMVEADRGYRGKPTKISLPFEYQREADKRTKDRARARHETKNCHFKQWGSLQETFNNLRDY
jgi:hypothetical protein